MRLAVDVMGGDHAPDAVIKGCLDALDLLDQDDHLYLVGDEKVIGDILDERSLNGDTRFTVVHASEVIEMCDVPVEAVRAKKDSSIVKMVLLGSKKTEHPCDAVLSCGNTGACVSAATMHMKRLPGVHRPGIAVTVPAFHGPVVLCDAGANPQPRATHLWQYGIMAEQFAKHALGIENPRVAMLNIGAEDSKGTGMTKEVNDFLRATPDMNYVGYVEGREFFADVCDVVVTDGFVGNAILKMAEGLAKSLFAAIAEEVYNHDPELALRFEPVVKEIYSKNDYHEYGGAPLLGVNGGCVIAHGSSEARTVRNAIRNSKTYVTSHVNDAIVERLAAVGHVVEREPA